MLSSTFLWLLRNSTTSSTHSKQGLQDVYQVTRHFSPGDSFMSKDVFTVSNQERKQSSA